MRGEYTVHKNAEQRNARGAVPHESEVKNAGTTEPRNAKRKKGKSRRAVDPEANFAANSILIDDFIV